MAASIFFVFPPRVVKIWGEISFKQVSKTNWEGIQYNLIVSLSFEGKSQPPKTPICRILHGDGYEKGQKPKKQIAKIFSFWELQELEVRPKFPHIPHFWQNWLLTKLTAGMIQLFLDATDSFLHISVNIAKAQGWRPFIYIVSVFHRDNTTFVSCQQVFNTCP